MSCRNVCFSFFILFLTACSSNNKKENSIPQNRQSFNSGVIIPAVSRKQAENLALTCKIWGFLKYYHPVVAEGKYDWDRELFKIIQDVFSAENKSLRNKNLAEWIRSLGDVLPTEADTINTNDNQIKLLPDLAWTEDSGELEDVAALLQTIRKVKRRDFNFYVMLHPGVGNPQFINERDYPDMDYSDAGFRLLSLFRYWNIIQYYFPYRNLMDRKWEDVLIEFIPLFVEAAGELEYKLAVLKLIASVSDTHSNIFDNSTINTWKGRNMVPVQVKFVENKAVVTGCFDPDNDCLLRTGDVLLSIDNIPLDSIVRSQIPYSPASNYPTCLRVIAEDLLKTNAEVLVIEYERGEGTQTESVPCIPVAGLDIPHWSVDKNKQPYSFITPETGYIYPGTFKPGMVSSIMEEFKETKGLIVDMRCYPAEFIVFDLGAYFTSIPVKFAKFSKGNLQHPGLFTFTEYEELGTYTNEYYKGKVVVLVNEQTQSQAEYTTMAFQAGSNVTVIGSTTAGADGNMSFFSLPGNISTGISGIGVYYPDGTETQRVGIIPDIEVHPTIAGIRNGKDEVLEKAVEFIR